MPSCATTCNRNRTLLKNSCTNDSGVLIKGSCPAHPYRGGIREEPKVLQVNYSAGERTREDEMKMVIRVETHRRARDDTRLRRRVSGEWPFLSKAGSRERGWAHAPLLLGSPHRKQCTAHWEHVTRQLLLFPLQLTCSASSSSSAHLILSSPFCCC